MDKLPEDLILTICLFIETKDLPSLLLLNHHWIDVSKYEVLWKFHYTNFLYNKSIQNEKNNKKKSYYRTRYKSQIDETLNLFERQKYLEKKENSEELSSNLFIGDRFYTIFKKEVFGLMITSYNNYLTKFFDIKLNLKSNSNINNFLALKEYIEKSVFFTKWKDTLQFLKSKITKPLCDDSNIDEYHFIYLRSNLYVNTLLNDFHKLKSFIKQSSKYLSNEDLKLSKEYIKKITSVILLIFISSEPIINIKEFVNGNCLEWIESSPLKEELNMKPFSYVIDLGFNFTNLLKIKDISLIHYLISEMEKDLNNENKRFLSFKNLDYNLSENNNPKKKGKGNDAQSLNVLTFCYEMFTNSISSGYDVQEIDGLLTFINNNFKELNVNVPKELFNDNEMNSKLCYFLYNLSISDKRNVLVLIFTHGYDLTKKAILEWKLTHETFFLEIMGFNGSEYRAKTFTLADAQALELFKLYKEVNPTCQLVVQDLKLFSKKLSLVPASYLIKELANNLMIEKGITDEKEAIKIIVNLPDDQCGLSSLFLHCRYMARLWDNREISEAFNIIEYLVDCGAIPINEEVNSETLPVEVILTGMARLSSHFTNEQSEDSLILEEKKDKILQPYEELIYRMVTLGADPGKRCEPYYHPIYKLAGSSLSSAMKSRMMKKFVFEYGLEYNPIVDEYGTTLFECDFWERGTDKTVNGKTLLEELGVIHN
ncbi:hypothetical protein ABK040_012970 [Willaertia magna]